MNNERTLRVKRGTKGLKKVLGEVICGVYNNRELVSVGLGAILMCLSFMCMYIIFWVLMGKF